jgi:hypothetical protein
VGPRAVLDAVVKRKIPSPRRESNLRPIISRFARYLIGIVPCSFRSRGSSVGVATGYGLDGVLGFDSRRGLGIFLFSTASRPALGPTQPPIRWVLRALSPGVKQPGCEADHSPPSSAEVKNA